MAYDTDADDNAVRADVAKLKRNPAVALILRELLRSRRLQDLDSVGELIADTKEDRLAAKESEAHAAVAAFDRMRGNWLGVEKTRDPTRPGALALRRGAHPAPGR